MLTLLLGAAIGAGSQTTNRTESGQSSGTNQARQAQTSLPSDPAQAKKAGPGGSPERTESTDRQKPLPSFTPKERIPVDQGVDFPVDI
jgi:hypothetical protein